MSNADLRNTDRFRPDLFASARKSGADHASGLRRPLSRIGGIPLRAEPTGAGRDIPAPNSPVKSGGPVSGGGRNSSGGWGADGDPLRLARGRSDRDGPCFDLSIPPNGYAWWYVDGVSDDGKRAISIIAFIGSVFSPWYRWSGRQNPQNHCCLNVVTYGPGGRWSMTDRGEEALTLSRNTMQIGPSQMQWTGDELVISFRERTTPHIGVLEGEIRITPSAITQVEAALSPDGAHVWRPFAPVARIDVAIDRPGWNWSGHGYFDANFGVRALEADFSYWTWGRFPTTDGATCFYDSTMRDGSQDTLAVAFDDEGAVRRVDPPPRAKVARSPWTVRRETRADPGYKPKQVLAMLDAPFYNRAVLRTQIDGLETDGVCEAVDLDRFRGPWLMPMLAVRVPRRRRWPG